MKFLHALAAGLLLCCHGALAQTSKIESIPTSEPVDQSPSRKLPNTLEEKEEPKATTTTASRPPDEVVETFFNTLKADRVDDAYNALDQQFVLQDRSEEANRMREQTQKAIDAYGPVVGYELLKEEKLGTHLIRRTYLLVGEGLPMRWRFYFYRAEKDWQLIDMRVDDALVQWFEEK